MAPGPVGAIVSLSEAQAFVRVETGEEEAVLSGLIRTASALCESFLGQVVIARGFVVDLPASSGWQRLQPTPVQVIGSVEAVDDDGNAVALSAGGYSIDIDSAGDGWVRVTDSNSLRRVRVSGTAGIAPEPNGVPEPVRQGVLRLVSHLFTARDGADSGVPASVTALWRPYRRARLA